MAIVMNLLMFLQLIILAESTHTPLIPTSFNFSTLGVLAANGSSAVGGCSSVIINLDGTSTCNDPSSSVLFDGNIPTLDALDGHTWASQLMIIHTPEFGRHSFNIYPSFVTSIIRKRVEVTIFNCPQWGTGAFSIRVYHFINRYEQIIGSAFPTVISCTSLVRVCIPFQTNTTSTRFLLSFSRYSNNIHIAEIAFYSSSTPCPPFTTIPGTWTPSTPDIENTTQQPTIASHTGETTENYNSEQSSTKATTNSENTLLVADRVERGKSEESSVVLTILSLLVTIMTLQTTVIFIVVIVIACRRKRRGFPSRKETITHEAFEMEDQVYETVNAGRYIHGSTGLRKDVQFKKNESYAIPKEL